MLRSSRIRLQDSVLRRPSRFTPRRETGPFPGGGLTHGVDHPTSLGAEVKERVQLHFCFPGGGLTHGVDHPSLGAEVKERVQLHFCFPGGGLTHGVDHPTSLGAEVKERVQLNFCFPGGV